MIDFSLLSDSEGLTSQGGPSAERTARMACQATLEYQQGMQHFKLEGLVIAIVTPFQPTCFRLDDASLKAYLEVCCLSLSCQRQYMFPALLNGLYLDYH
jgi:hypothetical protein